MNPKIIQRLYGYVVKNGKRKFRTSYVKEHLGNAKTEETRFTLHNGKHTLIVVLEKIDFSNIESVGTCIVRKLTIRNNRQIFSAWTRKTKEFLKKDVEKKKWTVKMGTIPKKILNKIS